MTETVVIPLPGSLPRVGGAGDRGGPKTGDQPLPLLVGPENFLVETAVSSALSGGRPRYNPLVFFGPSGTGKSHLANGIFSQWRSRFPRSRAAECLTAVDFARELNDAVDRQSVDDFRRRFRTVELLVIEDIGRLQNKLAVQEELVQMLDALLARESQVVVTASVAPEALPGTCVTLRSRLAVGLSVPLAPPGSSTRLALVRELTQLQGFEITDAAAELMAEGLKGTVPELLGALMQTSVGPDGEPRRITVDAVRRFLAKRYGNGCPTLAEIAVATARHFGLRVADMRGPSRQRSVVAARDVMILLARELTPSSLEQIGKYLGGRDHTTVLHSCRKMEALRKREPAAERALEQIRARWG
ncbi:MAG: DnaA ATPase domain-containing protein [Planctomycetota bacterium]